MSSAAAARAEQYSPSRFRYEAPMYFRHARDNNDNSSKKEVGQYYLLIAIVAAVLCITIGGSILRLYLIRRRLASIGRLDVESINRDMPLPVQEPEKPPPPLIEAKIDEPKSIAGGIQWSSLQPICAAVDRPEKVVPVTNALALLSGISELHNVPIDNHTEEKVPKASQKDGSNSIHATFLIVLPSREMEVPAHLMRSRKSNTLAPSIAGNISLSRSGSVRSTISRESLREIGDLRRSAYFNQGAHDTLLPRNKEMLERHPGNNTEEKNLGHLAFGAVVFQPTGASGDASKTEIDTLILNAQKTNAA